MEEQRLLRRAEMLKALAHPIRLRILAALLKAPKCVNAMHELLKVRQTGISQHLTVLKHAGLVAFRQNGASRCYYLPQPTLVKAVFELIKRDSPVVNPRKVRREIDRALRRRARAGK